MTADELRLLAITNFALNIASLGICVCRMIVLPPRTTFWWIKLEHAFGAPVLLVSALSPWWGWSVEWGQLGMSAFVLLGFLTSYPAWHARGRDVAPDIVTDHAKLTPTKGFRR